MSAAPMRQPEPLYRFEDRDDEDCTPPDNGVLLPVLARYNPPAHAETRFWRRQFQPNATRGQRTFDWLFGVILPVVCFSFDPIVFNNSLDTGDALLADMRMIAYPFAYAAIMGNMAWLLFGERLGKLNDALGWLLASSSLVALVIGVRIAPYSLMGLLILIGALGFTPLFMSFSLLRNAVRAFRAAAKIPVSKTRSSRSPTRVTSAVTFSK